MVSAALTAADSRLAGAAVADADAGYTVALVDAEAERTFVTAAGAEGRLTRADLDRVAVGGNDLVSVSGYSLVNPVNARSLPGWLEGLDPRVRTIFDPSPVVDAIPDALLGRVLAITDVLSANAREARLMTGLRDPAAAALAVTRSGPASTPTSIEIERALAGGG